MAGAVDNQIAQKDLHGMVANIYRVAGWLVVELHANRTNPKQMSGPDFLMLRGGVARAVKCLLKGDLSGPQEKVRDEYEAADIPYVLYHPEDYMQVASDAEGAT